MKGETNKTGGGGALRLRRQQGPAVFERPAAPQVSPAGRSPRAQCSGRAATFRLTRSYYPASSSTPTTEFKEDLDESCIFIISSMSHIHPTPFPSTLSLSTYPFLPGHPCSFKFTAMPPGGTSVSTNSPRYTQWVSTRLTFHFHRIDVSHYSLNVRPAMVAPLCGSLCVSGLQGIDPSLHCIRMHRPN